MSKTKAKIIAPTNLVLNGRIPQIGEVIEVDNRTFGILVTQRCAEVYRDGPIEAPVEESAEQAPEPEQVDPDAEKKAIKAKLDEAGVNYRANASIETLKELAEEL